MFINKILHGFDECGLFDIWTNVGRVSKNDPSITQVSQSNPL
jgi:hypothetical protein